MLFALDTDDGGLLAFPTTAEAVTHCKGIDVKDGFWLFYAEDGSPLEARFERQNQAQDSALISVVVQAAAGDVGPVARVLWVCNLTAQ